MLISQAEYARRCQVSKKTVTVWKQRGMPVGPGGLDPGVCDQWRRANVRNRYGLEPTKLATEQNDDAPSDATPLVRMQIRQKKAAAEKLELENAKKRGDLLDRAAHRRAVVAMAITVRDRLLSIPDQMISPVLGGVLQALGDDATPEALDRVRSYLERTARIQMLGELTEAMQTLSETIKELDE